MKDVEFESQWESSFTWAVFCTCIFLTFLLLVVQPQAAPAGAAGAHLVLLRKSVQKVVKKYKECKQFKKQPTQEQSREGGHRSDSDSNSRSFVSQFHPLRTEPNQQIRLRYFWFVTFD